MPLGPPVTHNFKKVPDFEEDEFGNPLRFENPNDTTAAMLQRKRERLVAIEHVKLIREDLNECYRKEGVNHYQNCKEIAQEYHRLIKLPDYGALYANK